MKLAKAAPPMVPPGAISGRPGNFPEEKVKAKGEICFSEEIRSADVLSGRRFVRMTFRQDGRTTLDVLSGLCLTTLDVLSGRIHVRRFVRKTFCQ